MSMLWLSDGSLLVPITVILYCVILAEALTFMVNVVVSCPFAGGTTSLSDHERTTVPGPQGPLGPKSTGELKPLIDLMPIVIVPE